MNRLIHIAALLVVLIPVQALAQPVVLTPPEVTALGDYDVFELSVSGETGNLAFTVWTPVPILEWTVNLWLMRHASGAGQKLTDFHDRALSAGQPEWGSGARLVYVSESPFGDEIASATPPHFTISPDGMRIRGYTWGLDPQQIAFVGRSALVPAQGPEGLFVANANGSGIELIVECENCEDAQWSPNDDVIAYTVGDTIWTVNPNGTANRQILVGASSPTWNPSTNQLAFECDGGDICVSNADGSKRVNLSNGFQGLTFVSPSWSTSGDAIVTSSNLGGGFGDLYLIPFNTVGVTPIRLTSGGNGRDPQFSPFEPDSGSPPPPGAGLSTEEIFYLCRNDGRTDICAIRGSVSPEGCDPLTCEGCCINDTCLDIQTRDACGRNGTCDICTGEEVCNNTQCRLPGLCDAASCPTGCCDEAGACQDPPTSRHCGILGQPCERCNYGEVCDRSGGDATCERNDCMAGTCSGCCLNGECVGAAEQSTSACGGVGEACRTCFGNNQCRNGDCVPPPCSTDGKGCIGADGSCLPGTAHSACGKGDMTCKDCSASGYECNLKTGNCDPPDIGCADCTGINSCCNANMCTGGLSPSSCGGNGSPCQDCTTAFPGGGICNPSSRMCERR
jgi:hypothetical protein